MGFKNAKQESYFLFALIFIFAALVIWVRTATVRDTYLFVQNEKAAPAPGIL